MKGKAAMNRFEIQSKDLFFDGGAGVKIDMLKALMAKGSSSVSSEEVELCCFLSDVRKMR